MSIAQGITRQGTAFAEGEVIPSRFTCDGDGEQPSLTLGGRARRCRVLALVVDDPDARGPSTGWCSTCRPIQTVSSQVRFPGARQAKNSGVEPLPTVSADR